MHSNVSPHDRHSPPGLPGRIGGPVHYPRRKRAAGLMGMEITLDEIPLEIEYKSIKHLHLKVLPPGGRYSHPAPFRCSREQLEAFGAQKYTWIEQQRHHLAPPETPVIDWGGRSSGPSQDRSGAGHIPKIAGGNSPDLTPAGVTPPECPVAAGLGVKCAGVYVQRMKTHWGSCNPQARTIRLNTTLTEKSLMCLDYVILHELAHILEPNHGQGFVSLMDTHLPTWRQVRGQLNQSICWERRRRDSNPRYP